MILNYLFFPFIIFFVNSKINDVSSDPRMQAFVFTISDTTLKNNAEMTSLLGTIKEEIPSMDWVAVNFHFLQATNSSAKVYVGKSTPDLPTMTQFVKNCSLMGLKVMIKPLIVSQTGATWLDIDPTDNPPEWFDSYSQLLLDFSQIPGIDCIAVGTELSKISSKYIDLWQKLITDLRKEYHGILTYASLITEFKTIKFWDLLDWVGLDSYFPLGDPNTNIIDRQTMYLKAHMYYGKITEWHQANYPSLKLVFTENGVPSQKDCFVTPWVTGEDDCDGFQPDFVCQDVTYSAIIQAYKQNDDINGMFLFHIANSGNSDFFMTPNGSWDCGFTPRYKPAWETIKQTFFSNNFSGNIE